MKKQDRIKDVELFVDSAPYLKGTVFRVVWASGAPRIEFKGVSADQIKKLRDELDDAACDHIKIVNLDKKRSRKRKKKPKNAVN